MIGEPKMQDVEIVGGPHDGRVLAVDVRSRWFDIRSGVNGGTDRHERDTVRGELVYRYCPPE